MKRVIVNNVKLRFVLFQIDPLFIIFQVGRGTVTPPVPEKASKEAAEFIEK